MIRLPPFVETLKDMLRSAGLPIVYLDIDNVYYEMNHGPDRVEYDTNYVFLKATYHRREFTAPLFRWSFEDGRKFQGRPTVKLKEVEWRSWPCSGKRWELEEIPMLQELKSMVERSWKFGEDGA